MFLNPFSFEGRIRRTEYGLSVIFYAITIVMIDLLIGGTKSSGVILLRIALSVPMIWFYLAQGAKRCHDLGKSGLWQIIPFYALWMIFEDGQYGDNEYGENPKGLSDDIQSYDPDENPYQVKKEDTFITDLNIDHNDHYV